MLKYFKKQTKESRGLYTYFNNEAAASQNLSDDSQEWKIIY